MGSLAAWGGLAGLGQGIAQVSRQNQLEREQREREDAQLQREQLRQNAMDARNTETLEMRRELAAMRANGGAGSGRGGAGSMGVLDAMANPELLTAASGGQLSREEAAAFVDLQRNGNPRAEVAGPPTEDGEAAMATKYEPGTARSIAERGLAALRSAMKLGNPAQADDLAKSEQTDYVTDAARRAEKGDAGAVRGALAAQGRAEFGEKGSSHITGKPADGSIASSEIRENESQVTANGALAAKRRAEAASESAGGGKGGGSAKVKSSFVNAEGNRIQLLTDGTQVDLGKDRSYQSMLAREVSDIKKSMDGMGKASDEIERMAAERITARAKAGQPKAEAAPAEAKPAAAPAAPKGGVAEPKSKADYDALPVGALYRKDGKTYRKAG
jgi:hypothetical protein